jgi:NADH-quinone oxidoreductase subunit L
MNAATVTPILLGLLLAPLLGCALTMLVGTRRPGFANWAGPLSILAAFAYALLMLRQLVSTPAAMQTLTVQLWPLLDLGPHSLSVSVDMTVDALSVLMILVITGVGFLIHWYAVGYMKGDPGGARFFAYMNFFIFSMLLLVLAANLFILVIGWALVALSSYLLIGFWYERSSAVVAARKAFITQVIGDVALVIAAFLIFTNLTDVNGIHLWSLSLPVIFANASYLGAGSALITAIGLLLAVAAFAKSAQFPLHTWLPDAMEGPTPVSALIHAATMVTAGVYLIARFHPIFDLAPVASGAVAVIGIGTALMAGVIALSQFDIKRVIAYSTMSQIGLMIYAVGIGAYTAGMYQFTTHAIFKALLFMTAGNVIHALHGEQDIRRMGALASKLRVTEWCFLAGSFALAGVPIFAGWFSKEGILGYGLVNGPGGAPWVLYAVGVGINVLTGLYAFRLWATVFRGEPSRPDIGKAHEAGWTMLVPSEILAVLSVLIGIVLLWPVAIGGFSVHLFSDFLKPAFADTVRAVEPSSGMAWTALVIGTLASLIGVGLARRIWLQHTPDASVITGRIKLLHQLSLNKFYFDELYEWMLVKPLKRLASWVVDVVEPKVMDGWIREITLTFEEMSAFFRGFETGMLRDYASYIIAFAAVFLVAAVKVATR